MGMLLKTNSENSTLELDLSQKDLHAPLKRECFEEKQFHEESQAKNTLLEVNVQVQPSTGETVRACDEKDECKTPTKLLNQCRLGDTMKCPSAPRKPKSLPSKKRKMERTVEPSIKVSHDEIESILFTEYFVGIDQIMKKVRKDT